MNRHFSDTLVEDIELDEAKKKKNQGIYSSISYTTGCPKYNMDMFNKLNGTDNSGALSGTIDGHASTQAMSADTGSGDAGAGDAGASAGGMGEALEKQDIEFLVKDEEEAIRGYEKKIEKADSDAEKEVLSHIKGEEEEHIDELNNLADIEKKAEEEKAALVEAKRYVRRYYIRPQNIFCSNKAEIIKALIDIGGDNCTIYTLNNLGDEKDVTKLTNDDVIYYYDDEILYDKNHMKVMDYDLAIKHEEERDKINVNAVSDATMRDVYYDRMTDVTELEESAELYESFVNSFDKSKLQKLIDMPLTHNKFGRGVIKGYDNDGIVEILFDDGLTKKFDLSAVIYKDLVVFDDEALNAEVSSWKNFTSQHADDVRAEKDAAEAARRANMTQEEKEAEAIKSGEEAAIKAFEKDPSKDNSQYRIISKRAKAGYTSDFNKIFWLRDDAFVKKFKSLASLEKTKARAEEKVKDMAAAGKEIAARATDLTKPWLRHHVKKLIFKIPSTENVGAEKSILDKLNARLHSLYNNLESTFPGITAEGSKHFEFQNRYSESNPSWYGKWGLVGEITFDVPYADMPTDIQLMIDAAVRESNSRGHDAIAVKDDAKMISNVYLCFAILELFDNDLDFFLDDVDEALNTNPFDLMFEAIDATGKKLTEEDRTFTCCICGEEEKGYGNNPEPFKHEGRCCDACNIKFVIPARLAALKSDEE